MIESSDAPIRLWFAVLLGRAVGFVALLGRNAVSTVQRRKRLFWILGATIVVSTSFSVAQVGNENLPSAEDIASYKAKEEAASKVTTPGISGEEMAGVILKALDEALKGLQSNSKIREFGNGILGMGILIGMLWAGMKTMIGGKGLGELIGEWIPIFVGAGVVTAIIDPAYGGARQIVSLMDTIASTITGADVSSLSSLLGSSVKLIFNSIYQIAETASASDTSGSLFSAQIAYMLASMIFVNIMKLVTIFLVILAGCVFLATAAMSMVSIELVVCLAPIMVPFLIFKPLSWIYESWLKFLLGACMMKLIGAFMFLITGKLFEGLAKVAMKISTDSAGTASAATLTADITLYSFMVLLAVMAALFMAQVPSMATGLLSGSAGGAGFSGVRGLTQSVGARGANAAGSGASKSGKSAVAGGYNRTVGKASASRQGKSDASNGMPANATRYGSNAQNRAYQKAHQDNRPSKAKAASYDHTGI